MEINNILELIRSVSLFRKNYSTFIGKNLVDLNITNSEFSYLKEIINRNGIAQDEVIKNLSIDKAAATRIAQSLEKKDLIKRVRNENNKRFFNVYLTEKGEEYIDITYRLLNDFYNTSFENEDNSKFTELKDILKEINKNFI